VILSCTNINRPVRTTASEYLTRIELEIEMAAPVLDGPQRAPWQTPVKECEWKYGGLVHRSNRNTLVKKELDQKRPPHGSIRARWRIG